MPGFRVDDRRSAEIERLGVLPIRDTLKAGELAAAPIATIDPGAERYVPEKVPPVTYDLDRPALRLYWGEFLDHHRAHKVAKTWLDAFKPLLSDVVGEKPELLVYGRKEVARFKRNGQLNMKLLKAEQPDAVARYTSMKLVEVFDKEAFEANEPMLFEAYRARRLTLIDSGEGRPVLPA